MFLWLMSGASSELIFSAAMGDTRMSSDLLCLSLIRVR